MRRFWVVAVVCACVDGVSKTLAAAHASTVVYNLGETRIGLPLSGQMLATGLAMFLLIVVTSQHAWRVNGMNNWAGMVFGGALANTVSVVTGPAGVLDFIPFRNIVFNVADIWLWLGSVGMVYVVSRAASPGNLPGLHLGNADKRGIVTNASCCHSCAYTISRRKPKVL